MGDKAKKRGKSGTAHEAVQIDDDVWSKRVHVTSDVLITDAGCSRSIGCGVMDITEASVIT